MYKIYNHTKKEVFGSFDRLSDAKRFIFGHCVGTGETFEIFHLDKDLNEVVDFYREDM